VAAVRYSEGTLATPSGAALFRRTWAPETAAAAALAVVHRYGEHSGRYRLLAEALVARGYAVHAVDLRGHGRSPGARGHITRFGDYVDDTLAFVAAVRRQHDGRVYLLGHSLGGPIATLCAEGDDDFDGLILSSPFIRVGLPVSRAKIVAARLLSRLTPTRDIGNTLQASDLSHEEWIVRAYDADELNHRVATARWATEVLDAQTAALSGAADLRPPLLLQYAGADKIADPRAAEELFVAACSPEKTCRRYDGYSHEIFNETGRAAVYADLAAWLDERTALSASPRPRHRESRGPPW
jgi:alpha-beta hydrolase superfamily lysophospholipase